jgi:hypothetical protein
MADLLLNLSQSGRDAATSGSNSGTMSTLLNELEMMNSKAIIEEEISNNLFRAKRCAEQELNNRMVFK